MAPCQPLMYAPVGFLSCNSPMCNQTVCWFSITWLHVSASPALQSQRAASIVPSLLAMIHGRKGAAFSCCWEWQTCTLFILLHLPFGFTNTLEFTVILSTSHTHGVLTRKLKAVVEFKKSCCSMVLLLCCLFSTLWNLFCFVSNSCLFLDLVGVSFSPSFSVGAQSGWDHSHMLAEWPVTKWSEQILEYSADSSFLLTLANQLTTASGVPQWAIRLNHLLFLRSLGWNKILPYQSC